MIAATSTLPPSTATLPSLAPSSTTPANPSQTLNENDFLTLLTTQLENQDPLNPLTGADFAAELAQFSTATGVQGLQTGVTGLNSSFTGMQAATLVGHSVAVAGNGLTLAASGGTATGAINLSAAASNVAITVSNAAGTPVATLNLGPLPAGVQTFTWNGQGPGGSAQAAGNYQFSVSAIGANKATIATTPCEVVQVSAVALGGQNGPMLQLNNGLAPVAFSGVQEVF